MKNKQLCLCIPRISVNTTKQFIWSRIVDLELGNIDKIIEIGSGKVLTGLNKRMKLNLEMENISSLEDVDAFLKKFC